MGTKTVGPPYDEQGNGVVIDDRTLDEAKAERLALLAERRWRAEIGGVVIGGVLLPTDETIQVKITGARLAAEADPAYTVRWKVGPGAFVTFDAPTVIGLSNTIRAHIQACFDNEDAISALIDAATSNDAVDAVDVETGWPVQAIEQ
jgi:hypothetical protein